MTEAVLPLVAVFPLIGAAIALLAKFGPLGSARLMSGIPGLLSIGASGLLIVLGSADVAGGEKLVSLLGGWPEPWGIPLVLSGPTWISALLAAGSSFLIGLFILGRREYGAQFWFFFLVLVSGMLAVSITGDLFTMFVSFEIIAIAAYVLIAWERTPESLVSSIKYLLLSSAGILFFLVGVFIIYRDLGTLSIARIAAALAADPAIGDRTDIHLALAAICVGIGVRTAFLPFHTWLPEAHAYAPHPISALLSGALIKVSLFAMFRILVEFRVMYLNGLLLWIGGITALAAVVLALAQSDAKRLLAFHSVSQMGYILAAFASGAALASAAAYAHALYHALFKALLFLTVGTAVRLTGERNLYRMPPLGRRYPLTAFLFFAGALSIAGVPPFNGFAGKAFVLESLSGSPSAILIQITGIATVASFLKLGRIFGFAKVGGGSPVLSGPGDAPAAAEAAQHGLRPDAAAPGALPSIRHVPADGEDPASPEARPGALELSSMVILAGLCLAGGLAAGPVVRALNALLGSPPGVYVPRLCSGGKLLSTALTLSAGTGVYFAMKTAAARRASAALRSYAPGTRQVLLLFLAGFLLFAAAAHPRFRF